MRLSLPTAWLGRLGPHSAQGRSYLRHVVVLLSGSLAAKAVVVGASPFLARLYAPADFGALGVFSAVLAVLVVLSGWGYPQALMLPRSERRAAALAWLAMALVVSMCVMVGVAGFWLGPAVAAATSQPALAALLRWMPLALLIAGSLVILEQWGTRRKGFSRISAATVARSLGTVGVQGGTGAFGLGAWGLIGGMMAGQAAGAAWLGARFGAGEASLFARAFRPRSWLRLGWRYRRFALLGTPGRVFNALGRASVPILLGLFFGPAVVGYYWFVHRLIGLASESVGQAVQRVFFQRASELHRGGRSVFGLLVKNTLVLAVLAGPVVAVVAVAGESLFALIFGEPWQTAGAYARWLVLMGLAQLLHTPALELVYVLERQSWLLLVSLFLSAARGGAILLGGVMNDPMLAMIGLAVGTGAVYLTHLSLLGWLAWRLGGTTRINLSQ